MICRNCGENTGEDVTLACPNCGAEVCQACAEKTDRICPYCYQTLEYKT